MNDICSRKPIYQLRLEAAQRFHERALNREHDAFMDAANAGNHEATTVIALRIKSIEKKLNEIIEQLRHINS